MGPSRFVAALSALLACALLSTAWTLTARAGGPPPEGTCPPIQGVLVPDSQDVMSVPLHEGMVLGAQHLFLLKNLLPPEVWAQRQIFFFEGMRMEIGPCHRRYPVPDFYREATEKFRGKARVDAEGNLRDYVAGLPFPPDAIDVGEPDAALRWAWNLEHRYVGAGPVGRFRLYDLPSRIGSPEVYVGSFFRVRTSHRADLARSGYATSEAEDYTWVSGGRFDEPFNARHLAWRQMRPLETERRYQESDRTYVYVPTMRKPRRAATTWVDGLFLPSYRVGGDDGGGGVPFGTGNEYGVGSIQPTSGRSAAASENVRRGFTGLALRPNAYVWRLRGEREVLAPLNGYRQGWPEDPDRNFGESGLSVASDRWEVRWAVEIEGAARDPQGEVAYLTIYIDHQTQQPLYYVTRRKNRLILDVGIFVHRFSGDVPDYPEWPGGGPARVFDPVAAVFFSVAGGGTGWRRESYDLRSVPVDDDDLRRMTSVADLSKGR